MNRTYLIGGGVLLLLLMNRRAPDVQASNGAPEPLGGLPALLPIVGEPGNIIPAPESFAVPAACSVYSPPGECMPWNWRPPDGAINPQLIVSPPQTSVPVQISPSLPIYPLYTVTREPEAQVGGQSVHSLRSISRAF